MIAFLSDIHSNMEALGVCLAEVERLRADRIVCLGDVIGYGPQPREALRTIMQRAEFSLLGNHEHGAMFYASDFNPRARAAIDWTRDQLSRRDCPREENMKFWNYLDGMKKEHREARMLFVHASPRDPVREYLVPRDALDRQKMDECFAKMGDAALCFVGHSHVPGVYLQSGKFLMPPEIGMEWRVSERAIINIGSVGQPRDGDPRASFVSYDGSGTDGTVRFHRVPYDVEATMQKIRAVPELPDYLADRLQQGR
ncbi:MAG: metallophosphoesterase family protein [Planctomycetes bacterium]|nr:metallophosphoesterase family protein [Planctomycetota bacterium]MBZ0153586.1 metallophosphoesterase family protein [Planctomycetota bacterium]MCC7396068.1 metallophosphoesterase family protein [Planctomycetota bacterium]